MTRLHQASPSAVSVRANTVLGGDIAFVGTRQCLPIGRECDWYTHGGGVDAAASELVAVPFVHSVAYDVGDEPGTGMTRALSLARHADARRRTGIRKRSTRRDTRDYRGDPE